jgi:aspartyl-tRNA(Asn)/glutamyl-tRNA(Gln) amidotransferase subunit C
MAQSAPEIDVRKVAALARLALTEEEIALFSTQLASILEYANTVQDVDTTGVPPTSHLFATASAWREDQGRTSLDRDEVLRGAPDGSVQSGLFKVPKVL